MRTSSLKTLPPEILDEVNALIRRGSTIADIRTYLRDMGTPRSHGAVGRYKQNAEAQMKRFLEIQEVSKVWSEKLEESRNSEFGQLLSNLIRMVAQVSVGGMIDRGEDVDPSDIMLVARAIKDLASADKMSVEREMRIRKEASEKAIKEAEGRVVAAGEKAGTTEETIAIFRQALKGEL